MIASTSTKTSTNTKTESSSSTILSRQVVKIIIDFPIANTAIHPIAPPAIALPIGRVDPAAAPSVVLSIALVTAMNVINGAFTSSKPTTEDEEDNYWQS